jgi:hypothetical protein
MMQSFPPGRAQVTFINDQSQIEFLKELFARANKCTMAYMEYLELESQPVHSSSLNEKLAAYFYERKIVQPTADATLFFSHCQTRQKDG